MKNFIKSAVVVSAMFFSSLSSAVVVKDVGINYIGMYGHGRVFVSVDKPLPVPGCEDAIWLQIESTHPLRKDYYSMLLAAHAANKKIDINSTGCLAGQATIVDQSGDYVLIK